MQEAFGILIFVVVILATIAAVITAVGRGRLYDQIGRGGLSIGDEREGGPAPAPQTPAGLRERDEEIRQMLEASNERRARRGEERVDVEAELERLTAPVADPALREEVRDFVIGRNERRIARGQGPLDVDAEVERRLRER